MSTEPEMITIPRSEYEELIQDSDFLRALESHGLSTWVGYEKASEAYDEFMAVGEEECETDEPTEQGPPAGETVH